MRDQLADGRDQPTADHDRQASDGDGCDAHPITCLCSVKLNAFVAEIWERLVRIDEPNAQGKIHPWRLRFEGQRNKLKQSLLRDGRRNDSKQDE